MIRAQVIVLLLIFFVATALIAAQVATAPTTRPLDPEQEAYRKFLIGIAAQVATAPTTRPEQQDLRKAVIDAIREEALPPEEREARRAARRKRTVETAEMAGPSLRRLYGLAARVEVGIDYEDFTAQLRELQESYAQFKTDHPLPPDPEFADLVRDTIANYHLARQIWDSERQAARSAPRYISDFAKQRQETFERAKKLVGFIQALTMTADGKIPSPAVPARQSSDPFAGER